MNAKEEQTVRKFFEKGKLLTPAALKILADMGGDAVCEQEGDVIDVADIKREEITVVKNLVSKPEEATTEDFIKFYTSKYEKMRNILTGRLQKNFISLNKINEPGSEVYIIGIVKDIKKQANRLDLEDTTGTVTVVFEEDMGNIELDDVIAVRGMTAGKTVHGKQIIFPDIPLRQPATGRGSACFASNLCMDEAAEQDVEKFFRWLENSKAKYIFIAGKIGDRAKFEAKVDAYCHGKKVFVTEKKEDYPSIGTAFKSKNIISLSNPAIIDIGGVKILNITDFSIQMLKKRYLGKTKTILPEDYLVLDTVPDIVNFASQEHSITNYKSVTIVTSGSMMQVFRPVVIDLATREVYAESVQ